MKTLLHQFWQNFADRFERDLSVGARFGAASVVQAEDGAVPGPPQQPCHHAVRGPFPIQRDGGPQHSGKAEPALHIAETEPANAVGSAKMPRPNAGGLLDGILSRGKLAHHEIARFEIQTWM